MPQPHLASELRLEADAERVRLEAPPPSPRARWALLAFLFGGPLLYVVLAVAFWLEGGCLIGGLSSVLAVWVLLGWVAVLSGDKYLRELEIDRRGRRLRVRGGSYQGLFPTEVTLEGDRIAGLRLENLLADDRTNVRWNEAGRLIRDRRWLDPGSPNPEKGREIEDRLAVRTPVLRLGVFSTEGRSWTFLFRVEEVETAEEIEQLLAQIAAASGLPEARWEWSDERKVSVAAGAVPPPPDEPGAGAAPAGATSPEPVSESLSPPVPGTKLGRYRITVWDPPRRIVFRRAWGRMWLIWLWPIALFLALPAILEVAERIAGGAPPDGFSVGWGTGGCGIVLCALALLVHLWLDRPRRNEVDWIEGVARRRTALRRRELSLSWVEAVRLREDPPSDRFEDPSTFHLELLLDEAVGEAPLPLVRVEARSDEAREASYRRLAPVTRSLADALDVPCRLEEPGSWFRGLR